MDGLLNKLKERSLIKEFTTLRKNTKKLIKDLYAEDMVVQTENFVSPIKWHLGHTTWFFENFLLIPYLKDYRPFDDNFNFIFNSYYNSVGPFNSRDKRGYLTRPLLSEIIKYRDFVDEHIIELFRSDQGDFQNFLMDLGISHEQQHQELILMDIKHIFFSNPLKPAYNKSGIEIKRKEKFSNEFILECKVKFEYGDTSNKFCYDNELPTGLTSIDPIKLSGFVTNGQWKEFIEEGGYDSHEFWLSDGWDFLNKNNINKPLYWIDKNHHFTLSGVRQIDNNSPVSHISFYEACAFAKYKGLRLPNELEIEYFLKKSEINGNFLESKKYCEVDYSNSDYNKLIFGNLWLWTSSNYVPYKNYKPFTKKLMEYNSKFMCNQFVMKGGSFGTPINHMRASYRNFYYPHNRWQFSGLRLIEDL